MPKTPRVFLEKFGADALVNDVGQFGSKAAGTLLKTTNISTIQALDAWKNGIKDALLSGDKAMFVEDANALNIVFGYMLSYLLEAGIPEWDPNTPYFVGCYVRDPGTGDIYQSLIDNNTGNALPARTDNSKWMCIFPVRTSQLIGKILSSSQLSVDGDLSMVSHKITGLAAGSNPGDAVNYSQLSAMAQGILIGYDGSLNGFNHSYPIAGNLGSINLTGRPVLLQGHLNVGAIGATNGQTYSVSHHLYRDASLIAVAAKAILPVLIGGGYSIFETINLSFVDVPSAGAHVYTSSVVFSPTTGLNPSIEGFSLSALQF